MFGVGAEGGGGLLGVMITSRSWKVDVVKDVMKERAQDSMTIEGNKARFGMRRHGIRLIVSYYYSCQRFDGAIEDSEERLFLYH